MHFETGNANEETGSAELFLLGVVAEDVADVLAEEALDALAEFLHTVHVTLVHLPLDAGPGLERWDFPVHFIIPGDVGDEILDQRKSLHREYCDGLIERERIHARLASEPGPAIHLGGTRPAFSCLAIPAHSEVGSLVGLDRVQRIEYNHAGNEWDAIIGGLAAFAVAPEHPQGCFRHFEPPAIATGLPPRSASNRPESLVPAFRRAPSHRPSGR